MINYLVEITCTLKHELDVEANKKFNTSTKGIITHIVSTVPTGDLGIQHCGIYRHDADFS